MHRLTARLARLEKQCRGDEDHVLVPINEAGTVVRLPRRWVEFLIERDRGVTAGGRHDNRTDGQ
jgi:hypothetical protein